MIDVTQCYTRPIKWTDINELEKTISKLEQQEKHKLSLSDQRNQIKKKMTVFNIIVKYMLHVGCRVNFVSL